MLEHFPPHLAIVLSVVPMELFDPHKMAEIRPIHSNDGVPDPRIRFCTHFYRGIVYNHGFAGQKHFVFSLR